MMFGWLFGKKKKKALSWVDGIINLMDNRPLEWEFSDRGAYYPYKQTLHHTKTNLKFELCYSNHSDAHPTSVRVKQEGQARFRNREENYLLAAIERLRHNRFNAVATKYLKLENKIICCGCEKKILGWSWVCKCQSALDQNCYQEANVCPDCGGSLVGDISPRTDG